jgi:hypothetical protein
MKITLRNWIKTLKPKQNGIAQKQGEIGGHMNNVHALHTPAFSSKQNCSPSKFSYIRVEHSKGIALHALNQKIV